MSNKGRDRWGPVVWEWIYRYGKTQARAKNQKTTPRQAAAAATEAEGEDEGEEAGLRRDADHRSAIIRHKR